MLSVSEKEVSCEAVGVQANAPAGDPRIQSEKCRCRLKILLSHSSSITALTHEFGLNWRTVKCELESPDHRTYGSGRGRPA